MPQAWDVENRLTSVSGGASATFVYDGDALRDRVKGTVGGVTTYYVGNYYEYSNSVATSYYYAGSTRVAMKQGSTVYYLLSDHLGSTAVTANYKQHRRLVWRGALLCLWRDAVYLGQHAHDVPLHRSAARGGLGRRRWAVLLWRTLVRQLSWPISQRRYDGAQSGQSAELESVQLRPQQCAQVC
jgi:hypothetical protein